MPSTYIWNWYCAFGFSKCYLTFLLVPVQCKFILVCFNMFKLSCLFLSVTWFVCSLFSQNKLRYVILIWFISNTLWDGSLNSNSVKVINSISDTAWIICMQVLWGSSAFLFILAQPSFWYKTFAIAFSGHLVEFNCRYIPLSSSFCKTS